MLYPKNKAEKLSAELFQNPTSEYRGTPFWAWNCHLDEAELLRQIGVMQEMGFGGAHMHVRSGMDTAYLSDEFMKLIHSCCDEAERRNMLAWLYDEDRWPSGFAGGFVTKDPEFRIRNLLFTPTPYEQDAGNQSYHHNEQAVARRTGNGVLLGIYDIVLDENGCLASYRKIDKANEAQGKPWFAYMETAPLNPRYNGYTYVDTLNKKAIDKFVEVTHEAYKREIGDKFGKSVPAIFTDEPQFTHKTTLRFPDVPNDVTLPWTADLPDTFKETYGEDLLEGLPELIWELPGNRASTIRYHYHDHACERFTDALARTLGKWCEDNGLALTGHMMKEPTLSSQCSAVGEAMRSLSAFQLPGIDMLADRYELTTAKQAQSVAHQYGREGVMSELYGVTTWDYDFRGHKLQGDWQAALGITVRVPHLAWVSMQGEAKRDYPASINYQSPWYKEYAYVEDHFARVHTAMTRGKAKVRVGVIHPIESFWLHFGPSAQTALIRDQLDDAFENVTNWLLYGTVDFDYICESLLPELCPAEASAPMQVGAMAYDVIIVPGCETLRTTTYERLESFRKNGGKVIFLGNAPKMLDAIPSDRPEMLAKKAGGIVPFNRGALLSAVNAFRTVEIRNNGGELSSNLLYQLREDGDNRWLFIAQGKHPYNKDISRRQGVQIRVRGKYDAKVYNTLDGTISDIAVMHAGENTVIPYEFYGHDSLLLCLTPAAAEVHTLPEAPKSDKKPHLPPRNKKVAFTRDEPNVLLLDMAKYSLDDEPFSETEEELLRIDTAMRKRFAWIPWGGGANQPWCIEKEPNEHRIRVRFRINSEIELTDAKLALETPYDAKITLNGAPVSNKADGYYVDKSIECVALPTMPAGISELEVEYPFGQRTALEWMYILGDFDVEVDGKDAVIKAPRREIGFDSIVDQGMPFYSGALTYHLETETKGGALEVTVPQYRGSAIRVTVDDDQSKMLVYQPYRVKFDDLAAGKHKVDIKLYVPRTNGFGPVHLADGNHPYHSPGVWRTSGDSWTYEYRLLEEGILSAPWMHEV